MSRQLRWSLKHMPAQHGPDAANQGRVPSKCNVADHKCTAPCAALLCCMQHALTAVKLSVIAGRQSAKGCKQAHIPQTAGPSSEDRSREAVVRLLVPARLLYTTEVTGCLAKGLPRPVGTSFQVATSQTLVLLSPPARAWITHPAAALHRFLATAGQAISQCCTAHTEAEGATCCR